MKKLCAILLTAALLLTGCASSEPGKRENAPIADGAGQQENAPASDCGTVVPADPVAAQLQPPQLELLCGGKRGTALLGTYSWMVTDADGTGHGVCADAMHPLGAKQWLDPMCVTDGILVLSFERPPAQLSVRRWKDTQWEHYGAEPEEVCVNGNRIDLLSGGYVYEVTADWEGASGSGTAYYSFYIQYQA